MSVSIDITKPPFQAKIDFLKSEIFAVEGIRRHRVVVRTWDESPSHYVVHDCFEDALGGYGRGAYTETLAQAMNVYCRRVVEKKARYGGAPEFQEWLKDLEETEALWAASFRGFAEYVHRYAVAKGWWPKDKKDRNDAEMIALMHSELSEALEALRAGNPHDDKVPQHNGAVAELADCIIRIVDLCAARDWDIAQALVDKQKFNLTRPHKHGGKKF